MTEPDNDRRAANRQEKIRKAKILIFGGLPLFAVLLVSLQQRDGEPTEAVPAQEEPASEPASESAFIRAAIAVARVAVAVVRVVVAIVRWLF